MAYDSFSRDLRSGGLRNSVTVNCTALILASCVGCTGGAKVELAAADAIEQLSHSLAAALEEHHGDLTRADTFRERSAAKAFSARLRGSENVASADADEAAFFEAMERIRADRETAWRRHMAAMDNIGALGEIARGLRRLAIETMSLNDEARRYFDELLGYWQSSRAALDPPQSQ